MDNNIKNRDDFKIDLFFSWNIRLKICLFLFIEKPFKFKITQPEIS